MSKNRQINKEAWVLSALTVAIISAVFFVAGMLFAVDTGSYGRVDKFLMKGGVPCRQYVVDEHRVSLCNNGTILVEDME